MNQTENVDKIKSEIYHPLHWGNEFYVSGIIQFQRERKNVMDGSKTDKYNNINIKILKACIIP